MPGRKAAVKDLGDGELVSTAQAQALLADPTLTLADLADPTPAGDHDGSYVANVADANATGGLLVVHRVLLASGADANVDVALTHTTRVIDAVVVLKGAGTAGSDVQVQNVTTAITDLIDVSAGADQSVHRAGTIDDAQHEVAALANLRVAYTSTGGDFPGAEVYVTGMRVA